jgi:hypothetical protein
MPPESLSEVSGARRTGGVGVAEPSGDKAVVGREGDTAGCGCPEAAPVEAVPKPVVLGSPEVVVGPEVFGRLEAVAVPEAAPGFVALATPVAPESAPDFVVPAIFAAPSVAPAMAVPSGFCVTATGLVGNLLTGASPEA